MFTEPKIAPSILSAHFMNMARDVAEIEEGGAAFVHVDVMDGHFVPNLTLGVPFVAGLKKITKLPLDVHLMISNPTSNSFPGIWSIRPISSRCMLRRSTPMPASLIWQSI